MEICQNRRFLKGDHFECKFQTESGVSHQHCWRSRSRVIAFSKYLQCIVCLFHKARVWQTDRRTELRLPRPR